MKLKRGKYILLVSKAHQLSDHFSILLTCFIIHPTNTDKHVLQCELRHS